MKSYRHWPRAGDAVHSSEREDTGLRADGTITWVNREDEEVTVKWAGRKVVSVVNCFQWNGYTVRNHHYEIDGIWRHSLEVIDKPGLLLTGGDNDTFSFDDLEGNWSSSEGGKGAYYI